ncbi:MAG TPA: hypothetical protein VEI95_18135 [Acidobacteriota bacterium]|nr:hypothetical protein [Acidobacteriota bacterium]
MQLFKDFGYAGLLRPIGQSLESLRIDSFTVITEDDGFVVRDKTRNRAQLTPRERAFLSTLSASQPAATGKQDALRQACGIVEWHLTHADIERLDLEGRGRRRDTATEQPSDSHSISQILRMIGEMVDQKRGRLISVSKIDELVTVEFLSSEGQLMTENYTLPMIYDFWVRAYKKRGARNSAHA